MVPVRIVPVGWTIAKKTPVKNQINIFREAVDEPINFREGGSTLEEDLILKVRVSEEPLQNPTHPKILLDDDWVHPQFAR
jgi:hypothetical protein